jgi:hypothetical protein
MISDRFNSSGGGRAATFSRCLRFRIAEVGALFFQKRAVAGSVLPITTSTTSPFSCCLQQQTLDPCGLFGHSLQITVLCLFIIAVTGMRLAGEVFRHGIVFRQLRRTAWRFLPRDG